MKGNVLNTHDHFKISLYGSRYVLQWLWFCSRYRLLSWLWWLFSALKLFLFDYEKFYCIRGDKMFALKYNGFAMLRFLLRNYKGYGFLWICIFVHYLHILNIILVVVLKRLSFWVLWSIFFLFLLAVRCLCRCFGVCGGGGSNIHWQLCYRD